MTNLKITANWLITVLIGSGTLTIFLGIGEIRNSNFIEILIGFFGGVFFLSIISAIASLPFIFGLGIFCSISPITPTKWRQYFIPIHLLATIFNTFILLVINQSNDTQMLFPITINYMIIGIITWYISIRKAKIKNIKSSSN